MALLQNAFNSQLFFYRMSALSNPCSRFQEIRAVGAELGITPVIICGEELKRKGFGGTVTPDICVKQAHLSLILVLRLGLSVSLLYDIFSVLCKINAHLKEMLTSSGIYGVGKAAEHPPALAVLSHKPDGATQTIAWVGKGIVYDTGGLSIKGKVARGGLSLEKQRDRPLKVWVFIGACRPQCQG